MSITLQSPIYTWDLNGNPRSYGVVTLPYGVARQIFKVELFSAANGRGEQRPEIESHVKRLQKEMLAGNYTPTVISVGTRKSHREALKTDKFEAHDQEGQVAFPTATLEIDVDSTAPLPLLDGGQRFFALSRIRKTADEEQQKKIDALPITAFLYYDGNTKQDFLRINRGQPIDAAHTLSMKVCQKDLPENDKPYFELAMEVAKLINNTDDNPFKKQIRFDSKGLGGLPISSLCGKGSSDIATSLIGLAKVGLHANDEKKMTAEDLAKAVTEVYRALEEGAFDLLQYGKVLTPPPDGTRGSSSMLIGLSTLFVYRMFLTGKLATGESGEVTAQKLVESAKSVFENVVVHGNFSGPDKRAYMGAFAKKFLEGFQVEYHDGVPKDLVRILSASTFGLSKLPREKKPRVVAEKPKRGRKKKAVEAAQEVPVSTNEQAVTTSVAPAQAEPTAPEVNAAVVEVTTPAGEPAPVVETFETVGADVAPWEEVSA